MSVKDFFSYPIIKNKVIEFLKAKGDFEYLHAKHKKPFRGFITCIEEEKEFYVCDDFNMIKCQYSPQCKEKFEQRYPKSISIYSIYNMLVCLQDYRLIIRDTSDVKLNGESALQKDRIGAMQLGSKIEVIMEIDHLDVISFDRFSFKRSPSIQYDEGIRIHTNFLIHYLNKKALVEDPSNEILVPISEKLLPQKEITRRNESYRNQAHHIENNGIASNENKAIVQLKNDPESKKSQKRQKLRKLKEGQVLDGFQSCSDEQAIRDDIEDEDNQVNIIESFAQVKSQNTQKPKGILTQKREKELDEIDEMMENFLDVESEVEEEEDKFSLGKSKTHQEVLRMSQVMSQK